MILEKPVAIALTLLSLMLAGRYMLSAKTAIFQGWHRYTAVVWRAAGEAGR